MNAPHFTPALLLAALLTGCAQQATQQDDAGTHDFRYRAPQVATLSETTTADVTAELEFGREIAARILARYPLHDDPRLSRYVSLVGKAVAAHSGRSDIAFNFAVIRSDTINAYATPGGYVFITTGALAAMQSEAELAGVLAHEIAHITQKHIVRELAIKGSDDSALSGLSRLLGAPGDPARVAFAQAVDRAMDLLFSEGLKKQDELEADRIGTLLLAHTGYDAQALHRYLSRIQHRAGEHTATLSRTHPPFAERLHTITQLLTHEGLDNVRNPTLKERFVTYVR